MTQGRGSVKELKVNFKSVRTRVRRPEFQSQEGLPTRMAGDLSGAAPSFAKGDIILYDLNGSSVQNLDF